MKSALRALLLASLVPVVLPGLCAQDEKKQPWKTVAGKADVMKHVRKDFATFLAADQESGTVRLHIEGEKEETTWPVLPDAEIKIHGWWGRAAQLQARDRVWVWFMVNRGKKPVSILMIADEMSEQDIHDQPLTIEKVNGTTLTVHVPGAKKVPAREVTVADGFPGPTNAGAQLIAQTSQGALRRGVTPDDFEALRAEQQDWLRKLWRKDGLPGSVAALHPLGGEMEVLLDHEAIRWGRYLKQGDKVTVRAGHSFSATVNTVRPWRERTRVELVTNSGLDQADLAAGQRVHLVVPAPPKEIQESNLPPDTGRVEGKEARLAWFLSTIYCSCGIGGDRCTGMFYTQASCNMNACGMPRSISETIEALIEKGLGDREIFAQLVEERGRDLWRPHLLR